MLASKYLLLSTVDTNCLNDIGNGYVREFIKNGATFADYEDLYVQFGAKKTTELILNKLAEKNIEVLIYQADSTDFRFNVQFFHELQKKVFVVMMVGDSDYYFDSRDIYYAQCADLVVVYNYSSRFRFQHYGIDSISFYSSYDKNKYYEINGIKKDIETSFVGQIRNYEDREKYIDYLIRNGIPVEIYGLGSKNGQVSMDQMINIFNRTKININFTGITKKNALSKRMKIDSRLKQIKGRMAEVALCGGFVLTEYVPGIEEVFQIGEELEVFYENTDLLEKINYYLEHEHERESIAAKGHVRALKDYEISNAIPRLINEIEYFRKDKTKRSHMIYVDNIFLENYATYRFHVISKFIQLKKWRFLLEEIIIILKYRKLNLFRSARILISGIFPSLRTFLLRLNNAHKN